MTGNVVSVKHRGDKFDEPWMVLLCADTPPAKFARYHLIPTDECGFTSKQIQEAADVFEARYGTGNIWKMLVAYAEIAQKFERLSDGETP